MSVTKPINFSLSKSQAITTVAKTIEFVRLTPPPYFETSSCIIVISRFSNHLAQLFWELN